MVVNGPGSSLTVSKTTAPFTISINGNASPGGATAMYCSGGTAQCGLVTQNGQNNGTTTWESVGAGNHILRIVNNSATLGDRGMITLDNSNDIVTIFAQNTEGLRVKNGQVHIGAAANPTQALDVTGSGVFSSSVVANNFYGRIGDSTATASGVWLTYTTTGTATSGCNNTPATNSFRYMLMGKTMSFAFDVQCTSNSGAFNIVFPFALATGASNINSACRIEDNGAFPAGFGMFNPDGAGLSSVTIYKDASAATFTTSGVKRAQCSGTVEIQ
jgi:hypothetical protein